MSEHFDLVVLGAGSGGLSVAQRAAQYGARCAVVEPGRLGGTCVNVGCVPKKVMWHTAETCHNLANAPGYGFRLGDVGFDWSAIKESRDGYIARLNDWYGRYLAEAKVELIRGEARFLGPHRVTVGGQELLADHVVVATGSEPSIPALPGAEHGITSDGFFVLNQLPRRVTLVGAGFIAVELAGILHALGAKVTVVMRHAQFLRQFDPVIRDTLMQQMASDGIELVTHSEVTKVEPASNGSLTLHCKGGAKTVPAETLIWAIGRHPRIATLDLKLAGIELTDTGAIAVDQWQNTTAADHYAVGDVTGRFPLTPVAIAAGRRLADRLFGNQPERHLDYEMIPAVIFTHPPAGTVGLTEEAARERFGEAVKVYNNRFIPLYYGPLEHKRRSAMKLVCVGSEERVVGLHMVGHGADEMLQGFAVALRMGATKRDLDDTVAIHPTSAEEVVTMR